MFQSFKFITPLQIFCKRYRYRLGNNISCLYRLSNATELPFAARVGNISRNKSSIAGVEREQHTGAVKMSSEESPSPTSRLSIADYDVIGFDLDHTLAKYNLPNLFDLTCTGFSKYLVEKKGYDKEILQPFDKDKDFCTRGIILDMQKGKFLKIAEDGTILRASHGTRFLSEEEIVELYGPEKHWPLFKDLIATVNNIGDRYRIFENFFDMPIMVPCARIIDSLDKKAGKQLDEYSFWPDMYDAILDSYDPKKFSENEGGFFPEFKQNTSKYLEPLSDDSKDWLKKLRKEGKKLFIMTSSKADFALHSIQYILGSDWREYFDLVTTFARKPAVFTKNRPFIEVDGTKHKTAVTNLQHGHVYAEGNAADMLKFWAAETGKENPKILYFGDSLRSDIFPSKTNTSWDTALILEEMVSEWYEHPDEPQLAKKPKLKFELPSLEEQEYLTSSQWGSFFTDSHTVPVHDPREKYMNTLWGFMIRKYADISVPLVDYISDLPLDHKFEMFKHEEKRRWGFYPEPPQALRHKHWT